MDENKFNEAFAQSMLNRPVQKEREAYNLFMQDKAAAYKAYPELKKFLDSIEAAPAPQTGFPSSQ